MSSTWIINWCGQLPFALFWEELILCVKVTEILRCSFFPPLHLLDGPALMAHWFNEEWMKSVSVFSINWNDIVFGRSSVISLCVLSCACWPWWPVSLNQTNQRRGEPNLLEDNLTFYRWKPLEMVQDVALEHYNHLKSAAQSGNTELHACYVWMGKRNGNSKSQLQMFCFLLHFRQRIRSWCICQTDLDRCSWWSQSPLSDFHW